MGISLSPSGHTTRSGRNTPAWLPADQFVIKERNERKQISISRLPPAAVATPVATALCRAPADGLRLPEGGSERRKDAEAQLLRRFTGRRRCHPRDRSICIRRPGATDRLHRHNNRRDSLVRLLPNTSPPLHRMGKQQKQQPGNHAATTGRSPRRSIYRPHTASARKGRNAIPQHAPRPVQGSHPN